MTAGSARSVACIFAHPDDDTYAVAGSLALHAGTGLEITVILATSGDAGRIADPSLATRENLSRVREAEDLAAWRALGLEPDVRFLRHPDGRLAEIPREELVAEIGSTLRPAPPEVVVTFGPDGITGHADHVAIGEAATEAFRAARSSGDDDEPFRSLLHTAIPASTLDRLNEGLRERGLEPIDSTQPFMPRGIPDEEIGVRVDCSDAYERKLEALRCHRTQAEMQDVPFDLWPELLGTEAFVVAWPSRTAAGPVSTDLLALPRPS
jgi:LmbE family N-acetylglucosaminyl deacetylase